MARFGHGSTAFCSRPPFPKSHLQGIRPPHSRYSSLVLPLSQNTVSDPREPRSDRVTTSTTLVHLADARSREVLPSPGKTISTCTPNSTSRATPPVTQTHPTPIPRPPPRSRPLRRAIPSRYALHLLASLPPQCFIHGAIGATFQFTPWLPRPCQSASEFRNTIPTLLWHSPGIGAALAKTGSNLDSAQMLPVQFLTEPALDARRCRERLDAQYRRALQQQVTAPKWPMEGYSDRSARLLPACLPCLQATEGPFPAQRSGRVPSPPHTSSGYYIPKVWRGRAPPAWKIFLSLSSDPPRRVPCHPTHCGYS